MLLPLHTSLGGFIAAAVVQGLGYGLLLGALPARLAELAPADSTGIATGIYNSLRTLGGSLAGAIFAVMLGAAMAQGASFASVGGYIAIWTFSGVAFVVCTVALLFLKKDQRAAQPAA
jgi:MFS family permease